MNCPQCGEHTDTIHEGYCFNCCEANQAALDQHNAQFDAWERMSSRERDDAIRKAAP